MIKDKKIEEGDWFLINREEYPDFILLKRSDIESLISDGKKSLDEQQIGVLESIYRWMDGINCLK
jgi:hypothetical protein